MKPIPQSGPKNLRSAQKFEAKTQNEQEATPTLDQDSVEIGGPQERTETHNLTGARAFLGFRATGW